tara:strand:- start:1542 stop:3053 length:1512 start_codon:yes stop_codon:yes gene_type:complete
MYLAKSIKTLLSLVFMALTALFFYSNELYASAEVDDLVNKNLSKLEINNYKWTNKSMNSQPMFDVIEIQNNSSIGFKDLVLEVQVYSSSGTLYTFPVYLQGKVIPPGKLVRLENITTPSILPFNVAKTRIGIKRAQFSYENNRDFNPTKNIIIENFDYIIDSSASKTVQLNLLEYKNISENYYNNVEFKIIFLDSKNNPVGETVYLNNNPISPGEKVSVENFVIGSSFANNSSKINIKINDADLISSKAYNELGGINQVSQPQADDFNKIPIILSDLNIKNYKWISNASNTLGILNVEVLNESYFDYSNVVFEVYFMNSNGSTINKRRAKSKNDIFFAKSIQDAQVSVGLMDFKFSSIEMAIISGDSSLDKEKLIKDSFDKKIEQKANTDVSSKSNRNSSESEPSGALQELNSTEIIENIIIVNSTYTSSRASIKVLNLADYEIFDLILEISTTNGNTILFPIKKLKPRSEKTFYGIKLNELDIKDGQKISFKIIKANKFIKN